MRTSHALVSATAVGGRGGTCGIVALVRRAGSRLARRASEQIARSSEERSSRPPPALWCWQHRVARAAKALRAASARADESGRRPAPKRGIVMCVGAAPRSGDCSASYPSCPTLSDLRHTRSRSAILATTYVWKRRGRREMESEEEMPRGGRLAGLLKR